MGASTEERTLAMLSHVLTFLGYVTVIGFYLPPLIIYLMKKEQSRFVAFHALQSLYFHLMMLIGGIVGGAILLLVGVLTCGLGWLAFLPLIIAWPAVEVIYIVYAGIKASNGETFEYVFVEKIARASVGL